ncbi:MAG: GNAT family N-acetyltransferase [Actinobacteria bacterium]|nr:GNAT family N-acetyltransferase [Actinomycetota bacterium]
MRPHGPAGRTGACRPLRRLGSIRLHRREHQARLRLAQAGMTSLADNGLRIEDLTVAHAPMLSGPTVVGRVEATLHDGIAEIAYVIGPAHWGRGLGAQATGLLLDRLASMGIADAWAATHPGNHASMTVLTRLGFEECEPTLAPHLLSYDAGDRVFSRSCKGAR